ncbi:hypothetical protein [Nocardioides sp. InS609-2]|nr:hypothetical protein [Nocardioides sp. InS609-2]MBA3781498.1 hypothetical protein [Nocardioides sp.]
MIARRIAVAVVTAALSLGIVAITAPAQAYDTTWGHGARGGIERGIE